MKTLPFVTYKMSGTGNIFVFIDARSGSDFHRWEKQKKINRSKMAKTLCTFDRLAADGLIFFEEKDEASKKFRWDFYNADGSGAEMCGNAARCAGTFAKEVLQTGFPIHLETGAGDISVDFQNQDQWAVEMPALKSAPQEKTLIVQGVSYVGTLVNSGVPHFVLNSEPSIEICRLLRAHPDLGAAGANVTLLRGTSAKTFERGVENFTAACGTGAVAAAVVFSQGKPGQYQVTMPGGKLEVRLGGPRPILIGPALITAKMEIPEETFE